MHVWGIIATVWFVLAGCFNSIIIMAYGLHAYIFKEKMFMF